MLPSRVVVPLSLLSFLRRFAIACLAVAVLAAAGVVAGDAFARKKFEESRKIHVPNLVQARPGKPANYLLIGSDTRQLGDNSFGPASAAPGQRSDVMMVLHVDPATRTGRLVSFPRDLLVQIRGHGRQLLNSAYSFGGAKGPELVIQTLEENFPPLQINHYIEVNFKGFQNIVNAIGRIHLYFPTPVHDPFSGLNVDKAGCASADGTMALAYARSRHYYVPQNLQNPVPWQWDYSPGPENKYRGGAGWTATGSDLDRIPRQQYFLRTISQAAIDKTAANPTKLFGLLDAVKNSFTRDTTLKFDEMKALIRTFRGLDPRRVQMETLPVVAAPPPLQNNLIANTEAATGVIGSLMDFGDPSPPVPKPIPFNQIRVAIVNGSGVRGLAQKAFNDFTAAGFQVTGPAAEADRTNYDQTQVRFAAGRYAQAVTVLHAIGTLRIVDSSSANTLGADVLIVVGRDYDRLTHNFTNQPLPTTTSSSAPRSTTTSTSASTTTVPRPTVDTRFVPLDPKSNAPLVGCPH